MSVPSLKRPNWYHRDFTSNSQRPNILKRVQRLDNRSAWD